MTDDIGGVCLVTQPQRNRARKDHAHDLAKILGELTTVSILTANLPSDSPMHEEYEVVEFSSQATGNDVLTEALRFVRNQIRISLALRSREESTVLFFGATSYLLPVLFARLIGKTVIVLPRADVPLSLRLRWEETLPSVVARMLASGVSLLERLNYRLADSIVVYSPSMADQLGLRRYESKLHTNGARFADTDQFSVQVPYEEREQVVGFLGRLDVEKRVPELAAAARQLEDVEFVFIGDGDYRAMLERELATEIERGQVDVVGQIDRTEVPAQLNRLRLLVLPSQPTEGLPTAILEAMACGTPAFATPVSGVPDVVREGETGFLMEEVDGGSTAQRIQSILERDNLKTVSENGRTLIEDGYSFDESVERYATILTEISKK